MTLQEVAAYLKVHPNTVYRLARSGRIPAFKMGTDWRFERSALDRWIRLRQDEHEMTSEGSRAVDEDVLHLLNWMVSQGIALSWTVGEVAALLDRSERSTADELRRLALRGHVLLRTDHEGEPMRVTLSPEGLAEGRKRFGGRQPPPSGHESVVTFAMRHAPR
jgi:excisionase family DNA binding protein